MTLLAGFSNLDKALRFEKIGSRLFQSEQSHFDKMINRG